jgi:hypothetical protein
MSRQHDSMFDKEFLSFVLKGNILDRVKELDTASWTVSVGPNANFILKPYACKKLTLCRKLSMHWRR